MAFDHHTAADLLSGNSVAAESISAFVQAARWAHDDRNSLSQIIEDLRNTISQRDSEIELLKSTLLDAEADTARIDWIEQQGDKFSACLVMVISSSIGYQWINVQDLGKTLREAIDAAKSA